MGGGGCPSLSPRRQAMLPEPAPREGTSQGGAAASQAARPGTQGVLLPGRSWCGTSMHGVTACIQRPCRLAASPQGWDLDILAPLPPSGPAPPGHTSWSCPASPWKGLFRSSRRLCPHRRPLWDAQALRAQRASGGSPELSLQEKPRLPPQPPLPNGVVLHPSGTCVRRCARLR